MTINGSPKFIYKICPATLWQNALRDGVFRGAPVDLADGYIHFSSAEQAAETSAKHFRGQADLLLLHVDTASLGDGLKWESSRGGALFPHLYGVLDLASVIKVEPLPLGPDGAHVFRLRYDKTCACGPLRLSSSRLQAPRSISAHVERAFFVQSPAALGSPLTR